MAFGVAAGRPLYVLRTDRASNAVVVGDREALAVTRIHAEGHLYAPAERAHAKLRYRSAAGAFECHGRERRFHARPREIPRTAVATGQIAALYDGDAVVGRRGHHSRELERTVD